MNLENVHSMCKLSYIETKMIPIFVECTCLTIDVDSTRIRKKNRTMKFVTNSNIGFANLPH